MKKFIDVDYPALQIPVGSKIKFAEEKNKYTIRAGNAIFLICTKGRLYTVVDRKEKIRGTENLIFCFGAENDKQCQEMLERLTSGETEISYRNRISLNVEKYFILENGRNKNKNTNKATKRKRGVAR